MAMIELAEFAPDRSDFDPAASAVLSNFVPQARGYGPFKSFEPFSGILPLRPQGSFLANVAGGVFELFVATKEKLYKLDPVSLDWDDISKPATTYATPDNRRWSFAQYGSLILATNGVDPIQSYDTASPTTFDDLSATAPKALNVAVVGDFVFLTNTDDAGPRSAMWSGLNDPTYWQIGDRSCDLQVFPDGGEVMAVSAFEKGSLIFQEDCIREAALALNTPLIMTFSKPVENHGALAPRGVVSTGSGVFYLAQDGFYKYGAPPTPIGAERVDRFFFEDVNNSEMNEVVGTEDPFRKVIYWAYNSNSGTTEHAFNRCLAYHYALDRWSMVEPGTVLTGFIDAVTPGYTLDSIDSLGYTLDTLPVSLDDRFFSSGAPSLAAFNGNRRLGFFNGAPLPAQGQTSRLPLAENARAYVSGFRPITDAASVTGRVGKAAHAADVITWGQEYGINRTGLIPARSDGRFHKFEVSIPAGSDWSSFHGVEPIVQKAGQQ
jgi:hypothetical protein